MKQIVFNYLWVILFLLITGLRKYHEHKAGKYSSVKDTPVFEALLMLLWGGAAGIIPFIYIFSSWLDFADYAVAMPIPLALAGFTIFIAAIWLLHRSHVDLGRNWSSSTSPDSGVLVTTGVFKRIRHPMYSAHCLWGLAQTLIFPNWLAGPLALLLIIITLILRIPREERSLMQKFPVQYNDYRLHTGKLMPKLFKDQAS